MNKLFRLFVAVAVIGFPCLMQAQGRANAPQANPVIVNLVNQVRSATTPQQRQALVQNALRTNPMLARELVQSLITAFPREAATFTKLVVDTVVSLPAAAVSQEAKSQILTQVAQAAVNAALAIPQGRVESILTTVNEVKSQLASVPATFQQAVQQYIAPLTPESALLTGTGNNNNNENNEQEEQIISPDTL